MMVIPRGRRSSEPVPVPSASGNAPSMAANVVMRMGRKRSRLASKMASRELLPSLRSAARAKSIIRMAFFFTMPISRMMPIMAMTLRSVWVSIRASSAPTPADGKRGKNRDGMNVAFVEDAEHQVDGRQGRGDEVGLAAERVLIGLRGAGEHRSEWWAAGRSCAAASPIASTASPRATPGRRLKEMVTAGNSPW